MAICTRASQMFSGGNRGLLLPSRPLRRAKCLAREFGGWCRGLALVQSESRRTGGSRVSNPVRLAAAQARRLAGNRQPATVRSRTGCPPSSRSPQLPLRQRRLDRRDRGTTENRINTTFSWKAEEGRINAARGDIYPPNIAYYPNSVAGTFSSSRTGLLLFGFCCFSRKTPPFSISTSAELATNQASRRSKKQRPCVSGNSH